MSLDITSIIPSHPSFRVHKNSHSPPKGTSSTSGNACDRVRSFWSRGISPPWGKSSSSHFQFSNLVKIRQRERENDEPEKVKKIGGENRRRRLDHRGSNDTDFKMVETMGTFGFDPLSFSIRRPFKSGKNQGHSEPLMLNLEGIITHLISTTEVSELRYALEAVIIMGDFPSKSS